MQADPTVEQLRSQVRQEVKDRLSGKLLQHADFSQPILFSWQGLKHSLSQTAVRPLLQLKALQQLPELLEKAHYDHMEVDNHIPPRTGVHMHVFYADCQLNDQLYKVWLNVRQTPDGCFFYGLGIVKPDS